MKKRERVVLTSIVLCLIGFTSVFAQIDDTPIIEKDTTRRDNTRLVQEKNIRDTINDSTAQRKRSGKGNHNEKMYLIPDKEKKKSGK